MHTSFLQCTVASYMGGCDVEQTVEERDLGVLIDSQLKFHALIHLRLLVKQEGFGVDKSS